MNARLSAEALGARHGGIVALERVDLQVPPGSIVGLIGPNGAGKTTLIDTITGFKRPSGGRVLLDGRDITRLPPHQRVRAGLARTFQSGELFDDLTVADNLTVAAQVPSWRSTILDFVSLRPFTTDVEPVMETLGITHLAHRQPPELTQGDRQLVALGRALAARPRVVVLDEPAAGLGPEETERLASVIRSLPDSDVSVLLVDHDMSLVLGVCDHVAVLDFGRLIAHGTPDEVRHDPLVIDAYLGGGS